MECKVDDNTCVYTSSADDYMMNCGCRHFCSNNILYDQVVPVALDGGVSEVTRVHGVIQVLQVFS